MVDGREVCALQVINGSRAEEVLDKDLQEFGAMVRGGSTFFRPGWGDGAALASCNSCATS